MRLLQWTVLFGVCAPAAHAYCTTSGQPGGVTLSSHVYEIQDDEAYKQGRDVWVAAGVKADSQLFTWLMWSHRPTGQGCIVVLKERRNDHCGSRLDIQFEQRTSYNAGFAASDMPGPLTNYPYSCSTELVFHIHDSGESIPNPMWNPLDPASPRYIPDPGFYFYTLVELRTTGERYRSPGGVPSVPDGVTRNGECPAAQPDDDFPAFMLSGPNCPAPSVRGNSTAPPASWTDMTKAASKTVGQRSWNRTTNLAK